MTILDEILAGFAAALLVTVAVLLIINADLRADLAAAKANATSLSIVNGDLKDKTDKQNQALLALQAEGDARSRAAEKALKTAQAQAKRYAAESAAVAAYPASGGDCAAAANILRDYLKAPFANGGSVLKNEER
jgi:hypothetical protein